MRWATSTTPTLPTSGAGTGDTGFTKMNKFSMKTRRWVIYNPKHGVDYDASMVPATWFGWLHYKTDKTPLEKVFKLQTNFDMLLKD